MTYAELASLSSDSCAVNTATSLVQDLIGAKPVLADTEVVPYVIEGKLYGDVYVFSDYFINLIMKAFDTDCMLEFSAIDERIFELYLRWLDTGDAGDTPLALFTSLDSTLRSLVTCARIPRQGDCTDTVYTSTYVECAT